MPASASSCAVDAIRDRVAASGCSMDDALADRSPGGSGSQTATYWPSHVVPNAFGVM